MARTGHQRKQQRDQPIAGVRPEAVDDPGLHLVPDGSPHRGDLREALASGVAVVRLTPLDGAGPA